ncbi:MAG: hypothetical protein M0Z33_02665 [Actinomycetota bacterium]|nr:hypothetical protein [Actinomycetota bacterium]
MSENGQQGDPRSSLARAAIHRLGIVAEASPPVSPHRFPDGAHFRIEIPSVEGPGALAAVVDEAALRRTTVNRVSQGSGAMLLSRGELTEMARIGHGEGIEVSLFVGPRDEWDTGAIARSSDGAAFAGRIRGARQLRYALDDVIRASECGIRSFLVADAGLLEVLVGAQRHGDIPSETVWKVSAYIAPTNPASFLQLERIGASTINVPSDMTTGQLGEIRSVSDLPIDLYVESPDGAGGVVRGQEIGDIIPVASPIYTKFGLRNSRSVYPSGLHLEAEVIVMAREKVRRATIALEWLARSGEVAVQSGPGAKGLGVPLP